MGRVRIVSNRVVLPGHVLTKGDLYDGPDLELQLLVRNGSAEWLEDATASEPAGPESEPEPATVAFASGAAAELVEAEGLTAADFDGVVPSGRSGYTKADVVAVARGGDS